jgi:hypothetical protein
MNLHYNRNFQKFPNLFVKKITKSFSKKTLVGRAWSSSIEWKVENVTRLQLVSGIFCYLKQFWVQMSTYAINTSHQWHSRRKSFEPSNLGGMGMTSMECKRKLAKLA